MPSEQLGLRAERLPGRGEPVVQGGQCGFRIDRQREVQRIAGSQPEAVLIRKARSCAEMERVIPRASANELVVTLVNAFSASARSLGVDEPLTELDG